MTEDSYMKSQTKPTHQVMAPRAYAQMPIKEEEEDTASHTAGTALSSSYLLPILHLVFILHLQVEFFIDYCDFSD